jgi:hypothetical protein
VYVIFNREQPEPEDDEVRRDLAEHQLEPKRRFDGTDQERPCHIWPFGGCYLGTHLDRIADIQRRYLEAELLAQEIQRLLADGADTQGSLTATLPAVVRQRFQELLASASLRRPGTAPLASGSGDANRHA